jgi:hypothetical protein
MKFQKFTRGGHEYRIYASGEDTENKFIHGATRSSPSGKWTSTVWLSDGRLNNCIEYALDLLPEKKRRFKTAQELVDCNYDVLEFDNRWGTIEVECSGIRYTRGKADTLEDYHSEDWLSVFTTMEER